jgi:hypothetical protein
VNLLTGASLVNFRIKLGTGITVDSFDYEISLKDKTNSGELANATGSVTIIKDIPPVNIPPTIDYKNATLSGNIVNSGSLKVDFIVTDPDTDASDIELWFNLNNSGPQKATG